MWAKFRASVLFRKMLSYGCSDLQNCGNKASALVWGVLCHQLETLLLPRKLSGLAWWFWDLRSGRRCWVQRVFSLALAIRVLSLSGHSGSHSSHRLLKCGSQKWQMARNILRMMELPCEWWILVSDVLWDIQGRCIIDKDSWMWGAVGNMYLLLHG